MKVAELLQEKQDVLVREIDEKMAKIIANHAAKDAVTANEHGRIYRAMKDVGDYAIWTPTASERKSANTDNHYNILLSKVLDSWKDMPKRNRSVICTTSPLHAKSIADGSEVYEVYPYNGSVIGVAPKSDLWWSFEQHAKIDNMGDFPLFINALCYVAGGDDRDFNDTRDEEGFLKWLKEAPDLIRKRAEEVMQNEKMWNNLNEPKMLQLAFGVPINEAEYYKQQLGDCIRHIVKYNGTVVSYLNQILDPKKNGFKLAKAGDEFQFNKEVWTEGKCLLVHMEKDDIYTGEDDGW